MGNIFSNCVNKNSVKQRGEYLNEIYDGLDLDGSNYLEVDEVTLLWDLYRSKKIEELASRIDELENGDESDFLNGNKNLDKVGFLSFMNDQNLTDEDIIFIYKIVKEREIEYINSQLNKIQ